MYQFSYAEVQQDDVTEAKGRERQLLDRSIVLLDEAARQGPGSRAAIEALHLVRQVWVRFVEDLGSSANELDPELRANLISVALWILKEAEKIRRGESRNFAGISEVTGIIRDGLK